MSPPYEIQPLTESGFGAQVLGIDLAMLDTGCEDGLRRAFTDHGGLIVVRDQHLDDPADLCRFADLFGALEYNDKYDPDFLLPGFPEILKIGNAMENGRHRALFIRADPPPLLWHCDDSFRDPQPVGSCLYCLNAPASGGETGLAGMTQAYEALPDSLKIRIEDLHAIHSYDHLNEFLRVRNPHRPALTERLRRDLPPVRRPLVARHPATGRKSLYLSLCHIERIEGLPDHEGRELLDQLQSHATASRFTHFQDWRPGDLVLWHNRCTLHAPTPFDDEKYTRLMYRLTVTGDQIAGF